MDIDLEILKDLVGVDLKIHCNGEAANPAIILHYLRKNKLDQFKAGLDMAADISLAFTGIQFLEINDVACTVLEQKCGSPFAMSGSGMVVLGRDMLVDTAAKHLALSKPVIETLTELIDYACVSKYGIEGFKLILLGLHQDVVSETDASVSFPFNVSIPCTEAAWQSLFQLHSLELTAATEWYKQLQGSSEEVVTSADISPTKSLN